MTKRNLRPAVAAFFLMITMSLQSTALAFFVEPVCSDLGFGRGSFTLYYSLMVAAGAISTSILGSYMNKHGVRGVILVSAFWVGAGALGLSFSTSLWMFYLTGAAMGFFGSTCVYLAANVIVQHSYRSSDAAAILGLVMTGSGIGGVIWSMAFPKLIENLGWRFGYRLLGLCWLVLAILAALILGRQKISAASSDEKAEAGGTSKKEAFRSLSFVLVALTMCIMITASCVSQHLPSLLGGMGHGTEQISLMISVMTALGAAATVIEGLVCSKLGIRKTMLVILVLYAAGYCMLALGVWVYPALICLTMGFGAVSTLMPIVVREIFGGRDYTAIWSVVLSCSSVTSFVATPAWGTVYDMFGTYVPALVIATVLLALSVFALTVAFRKKV